MLNEMHIPVSSSIQDEYSNNVAFNKIFSNQMEQMNDLEDINSSGTIIGPKINCSSYKETVKEYFKDKKKKSNCCF